MNHKYGIREASAAEMLQREDEAYTPPKPLPMRRHGPYRLALEKLVPINGKQTVLHVIGDHGGVKDPHPQREVAAAMVADRKSRPIHACYSVGDAVYYKGELDAYPDQFGEPYDRYNVPILGIPGNHDGEIINDWMRMFCAKEPELLPSMAEYHRTCMTQPYCYWTLTGQHLTLIGLYSNVVEGGAISTGQAEWLVGELRDAAKGVPLIVALHHPPYSVDLHHGGSKRMGTLLDEAFKRAGRWPEIVMSGHVHAYQRFTRKVKGQGEVTYLVQGNSGYYGLHELAPGAVEGEEVAEGVTLQKGIQGGWGFTRLTCEEGAYSLEFIATDGKVHDQMSAKIV